MCVFNPTPLVAVVSLCSCGCSLSDTLNFLTFAAAYQEICEYFPMGERQRLPPSLPPPPASIACPRPYRKSLATQNTGRQQRDTTRPVEPIRSLCPASGIARLVVMDRRFIPSLHSTALDVANAPETVEIFFSAWPSLLGCYVPLRRNSAHFVPGRALPFCLP